MLFSSYLVIAGGHLECGLLCFGDRQFNDNETFIYAGCIGFKCLSVFAAVLVCAGGNLDGIILVQLRCHLSDGVYSFFISRRLYDPAVLYRLAPCLAPI